MKTQVEIKPTKNEIDIVNKYYGEKTAQEIAVILNTSIYRVYNICRYLGKKYNNLRLILTTKQHQLILGGIMGDGNIKRNGNNYYYREGHSKKEKDYCYWKYTVLKNIASKSGFHLIDNRDGQFGFQTINSPTFRYYKQLKPEEVIDQLTIFGALIYLLDDGWKRPSGFNLSTGIFPHDIEELISNKLNSLFHTKCKVIQHQTISFTSNDMPKLLYYFKRYIPNNLDIYHNKIESLMVKFKV